MRLSDRIRAELAHMRQVHGNHDRILALQDRFDQMSSSASATDRAAVASEIADIHREQARHLDASRLARATTFLGDASETARWWDNIAAQVAAGTYDDSDYL